MDVIELSSVVVFFVTIFMVMMGYSMSHKEEDKLFFLTIAPFAFFLSGVALTEFASVLTNGDVRVTEIINHMYGWFGALTAKLVMAFLGIAGLIRSVKLREWILMGVSVASIAAFAFPVLIKGLMFIPLCVLVKKIISFIRERSRRE